MKGRIFAENFANELKLNFKERILLLESKKKAMIIPLSSVPTTSFTVYLSTSPYEIQLLQLPLDGT